MGNSSLAMVGKNAQM